MKINKKIAINIVREESHLADTGSVDDQWVRKIERLSTLCSEGQSFTHIAFLATAILAKSVARDVDLYAIKPKHSPDNPNAFSARSLCHDVLVPLAAELGFSLGVTGREPLNNQPYFRMTHLGDSTPIHQGARQTFEYLLELIDELSSLENEEPARRALRAFIFVRRKHQPRYADHESTTRLTSQQLVTAISYFVQEDSEGGKRAQAIVAGLMDVFAGEQRVESGRINDPSRKYPGDVCIRSVLNDGMWEKAIEVRDKPVSLRDIQIFGKKCVDMGVRECAVVMVNPGQKTIDVMEMSDWADQFGIGLTIFNGWFDFVDQVLFWCSEPKPIATNKAAESIHQRLIGIEATSKSIELWQSLIGD